MFKSKNNKEKGFDLSGITPISMKDFPEWDLKNIRVVSETKCEFTLQFSPALAIHGMQCVERKDKSGYFVAPPQTSYKVKEGFYKNRNNAFIYLDDAFTDEIIRQILEDVGAEDENGGK